MRSGADKKATLRGQREQGQWRGGVREGKRDRVRERAGPQQHRGQEPRQKERRMQIARRTPETWLSQAQGRWPTHRQCTDREHSARKSRIVCEREQGKVMQRRLENLK